MTPPWRAVAACAAVAAAAGLAAGWHVATLSESDLIAAAAARYVATRGGRAEDCVAAPGTPPVWVTVICRAGDGPAAIYQSDRLGRITEIAPADPADALQTGA